MVQVIKEFRLGSLGLTKEDFMKKDFVTQLGYKPLSIDILNDMDEVPFATVEENKKKATYESIAMNFIGYNELLKIKAKAGRPQDMAGIKKCKIKK